MVLTPLVPSSFDVPRELRTERFTLRPLDYEVMLQDFEAVVTGAASIARAYQRDESYYRDFSLQDEVIELGWHIGEWRRRRSFAYAIMSPDAQTCFGSFYIYAADKPGFDALGILWTVHPKKAAFDEHAFEVIASWVDSSWPFTDVGYPGRRQTWEEWRR